jgi:transposase
MQADGNPINALPEDPALLQALLLAAWSERDNVVAERNALAEQNERLQHLLLKLKRLKFGAKSERLPEDQLQLALGDIETAIAQLEAQGEQRDPARKRDGIAKRRASRSALPAYLPRVEVTLTPEDTNCPCCRAAMSEIGHDESQQLDVIPAQYRVIVTRRPKFVCQTCEGVVTQAPAPARLIEGGIPTEALVANVIVSRFADHLPLYRQAQIMARQGVLIDRATLAFWVGYGAAEIMPVVRRLKEIVLSSTRIFADETTMRVLDPGRGRTKQSYFWVAARDDRACGGAGPPAVIY